MAANNMFAILNRATQLVDAGRPDEAYQLIKDAVEADPRGFAIKFLAEWIDHLSVEEESIRSKFAEIVLFLQDDYSEKFAKSKEEVSLTPGVALLIPARTPEEEPLTPATAIPVFSEAPVPPVTRPRPKQQIPKPPPVAEKEPEPAMAVPAPVPTAEVVEEEPTPVPVAVKRRIKSAPQAKQPAHREAVTLTFYDWQMAALTKAASKAGTDENTLLAKILQTGNTQPLAFSRYRSGSASPDNRITVTIPHKTKTSLEKRKSEEGIKTTTKYVRRLLFGSRAEKA